MIENDFETINENPLKIIIEANPNIVDDNAPFFVTVNGKRLENVKRFYLDWYKNELHKETQCDFGTNIKINPFSFGVEYNWDVEDENFSTVEK